MVRFGLLVFKLAQEAAVSDNNTVKIWKVTMNEPALFSWEEISSAGWSSLSLPALTFPGEASKRCLPVTKINKQSGNEVKEIEKYNIYIYEQKNLFNDPSVSRLPGPLGCPMIYCKQT